MNFPKHLFLITALALTAVACDSGEPDDSGAFDRPEGSRDVISDEQLQHLIDFGAVVHEGDNPPDLTATYRQDDASSANLLSDSSATYFWGDTEVLGYDGDNGWPRTNGSWCHKLYTFTKSGSDTYDRSSTSTNCDSESESSGLFISGDGLDFTLYSTSEGRFEDCGTTSVSIFSATIEEETGDMVNVQSAATTTSQSGECTPVSEGRQPENGSSTLTSPESGRAERW